MYSKLIVITNRHLCQKEDLTKDYRADYFNQIEKVVGLHPNALILREKDLSTEEYRQYAQRVMKICARERVPFFIHSHVEVAKDLGCNAIHFSIPKLRENRKFLEYFQQISVSCHSLEDAIEAQESGATQLILGNIFETDCKKGLPGKGLEFLAEVASHVDIPVYAIGGINPDNLGAVMQYGAAGGCMMSGFMRMNTTTLV